MAEATSIDEMGEMWKSVAAIVLCAVIVFMLVEGRQGQ